MTITEEAGTAATTGVEIIKIADRCRKAALA